MKHGDKAKATASTKASPEKSSRKASESGGKSLESRRKQVAAESNAQGARRSSAKTRGGDAGTDAEPDFARPAVAQAYSDALKSYHNALKRLTD